MRDKHPLRYWWAAPALAILMMVGAWVYAEGPRIGADGDMRFLVRPEADLAPRAAQDDDARLALDWRSRHDGDLQYRELALVLDDARLTYVGHDPAPGQWSAQRGDLYLSSADRARDGDTLIIGGAAASGASVRLRVLPCACYAEMDETVRLR